jgi:tetratricopeptide (TPR) repeat protein
MRPSSRRSGPQAPKPQIPESVEPDLPRSVWGELRSHARDVDDVARALTLAADALTSGDPEVAIPYLEWAKSDAPRAASIRETLGIARYHLEEWGAALSELQAYRRMSGRTDQNHVIADCLRALGRDTDLIAEAVQAMDADEDGPDRVTEGLIVWASALADAGDPAGGRTVLARMQGDATGTPSGPAADEPHEHEVRLWYVTGDLAERAGDHDAARRWYGRVADVDADLFDVSERIARLR